MKLTMERAQAMMNKNGGSLNLSGTQITTLPDNLTVGDSLYLSGTQINRSKASKVRRLQDGEYAPKRYLYADGILTHVRGCKKSAITSSILARSRGGMWYRMEICMHTATS